MTIREKIITFNVHKLALPVIRRFVKAAQLPMSTPELKTLPAGSLGHELYNFLDERGMSVLPYFETHDVKHVLLGYGTSDRDEACMQFFYLGNRHYSIATFLTVFSSTILMPGFFRHFYAAFKRGRRAKPIGRLPLESFLMLPTSDLRTTYQLNTNDHENN